MNGISGAIFGLVVGAGFILLGRWIYANPKKALYVRTVHASPDSPFLRVGAKIIGTFFISFGSCAAVIAALGSLLTSESREWLIFPFGAAVLGGRYLRPRIVETPRVSVEPPADTRGGLLTRKGRLLVVWAFGSGAALTVAVTVLLWTGESKLFPTFVMVWTVSMVVALAAILWL